MISIARPILRAAVASVALALPATAQTTKPFFRAPPQLDVSPTKPLPALSAGQTYAVDIDCKPRGPQLAPIKDDAFGLLQTTYTTTHAILLSPQQAISATITPGTLPPSGLGMSVVYVTDGNTASEIDNRDHGCKSTFVIRRQTNVFLIPFISLHTANQAGIVATIVAQAITPFESLFSLITGGPLAASVVSRISNFQTVETSFNSILAKLNTDLNYAKTVPLGVGTTTITTSQSVTTVKVRLLPSLINDAVDDFSNALRVLADSETTKVTQQNPDTTCNQLSNNVALDGIIAAEDRAYILGYEGLRNLQTKNDLMHCLGRLVKVAAGVSKIWAGQPDMTIAPDLAADFYNANFAGPQQLPFQDIKSTLDQLMIALGRYAQNGQPPSSANNAALSKLFVSNAGLADHSFANVFKSTALPSGFPAIIDFLISQGYYHFGCFAQTTDQTGLSSDGASSIFLAIKASPSATSAKKTDALAIHPIFADSVHTIQTLNVSDNVDWISSVLAGRTSNPATTADCNGFAIQ